MIDEHFIYVIKGDAGDQTRPSYMQNMCSTTELHPQPSIMHCVGKKELL